jgi:hypothetical protein
VLSVGLARLIRFELTDTKVIVEPVDLSWDKLLGHKSALGKDPRNGRLLRRFQGEWR